MKTVPSVIFKQLPNSFHCVNYTNNIKSPCHGGVLFDELVNREYIHNSNPSGLLLKIILYYFSCKRAFLKMMKFRHMRPKFSSLFEYREVFLSNLISFSCSANIFIRKTKKIFFLLWICIYIPTPIQPLASLLIVYQNARL